MKRILNPSLMAMGLILAIILVYQLLYPRLDRSNPVTKISVPEDPLIQTALTLQAAGDFTAAPPTNKPPGDTLPATPTREAGPAELGMGLSLGSIGLLAVAPTAGGSHYLSLGHYEKDPNTIFFRQSGLNHLIYVRWDSAGTAHSAVNRYGHYERKTVNIVYDEKEKRVLIPVGKTTYLVFNTLLWVAMLGLLAAGWLLFIVYPLRILSSIAKGQGFNATNGQRFRRMGLAIAVFALGGFFISCIAHLLFQNTIPAGLDPGLLARLVGQVPVLIVALALWLLGNAFVKGAKLQEFKQSIL